MAATARKTIDADADTFETAQAEWKKASAAFQALRDKAIAIETAISLANNRRDAEDQERTARARAIAGDWYELAVRRPKQVAEQLEEIGFEIEEARPAFIRANEEWERACRCETDRISKELQPRHRAAVAKIAKALEALSEAMLEEASVREVAAVVSPIPVSPYLPDCSIEIATLGTLDDWRSPASAWARRMRQLKVLS